MATATNVSDAAFCPHNGTAHDGTFVCHWTGGPVTRGTLNIFWLCVSTLGLCVWSTVHPDVPYPGSSWLRRLMARVGMLLVGLFMPEILVLTALRELRKAMHLLEKAQSSGLPIKFPWWRKYLKAVTRFCKWCLSWTTRKMTAMQRNGLELNYVTRSVSQPSPAGQTSSVGARNHSWTLRHGFHAVMGGYYGRRINLEIPPNRQDITEPYIYRLSEDAHSLTDDEIWMWFDYDHTCIPDISAKELGDRSKVDGLAKLLLIWQLFVFLANCAARWNQGLPLSLLEITTISHCLCSLVALVLWWHKPYSVGEVTVIGQATVSKTPPRLYWGTALRLVFAAIDGTHVMDVPRTLAIVTIAALYGLPHLLGLSVHFLSPTEELLWKIGTFAVVGLPLSMCFMLWIGEGIGGGWVGLPSVVEVTLAILVYLLMFLYATCSMFLVGESVRQLFALPEGSFHEPLLARYLPSFS